MDANLVNFFYGAIWGIIAISIYGLILSHFKVEEGHRAVLMRFGSVLRDQQGNLKLFTPGGHFKWPWEKAFVFSIMERVIDLSGEDGGQHAMASDGTVVRLDSKIRFLALENESYSYLFDVKNPLEHIKEKFTCIIRNEIANFQNNNQDSNEMLGSYSLIRRERQSLNEQVEIHCKYLIGQNHGVRFSGMDLIDIIPPIELESALNGIQKAKTEANILYTKAEADSQQRIISAEKGVEIAKVRAESVGLELYTLAKMIKTLISEGSADYFIKHKKTELIHDSKMLFVQREDLKC